MVRLDLHYLGHIHTTTKRCILTKRNLVSRIQWMTWERVQDSVSSEDIFFCFSAISELVWACALSISAASSFKRFISVLTTNRNSRQGSFASYVQTVAGIITDNSLLLRRQRRKGMTQNGARIKPWSMKHDALRTRSASLSSGSVDSQGDRLSGAHARVNGHGEIRRLTYAWSLFF